MRNAECDYNEMLLETATEYDDYNAEYDDYDLELQREDERANDDWWFNDDNWFDDVAYDWDNDSDYY